MSETKIDQIIRKPQLLKILGIGNSTLYAWMAKGYFPKPLQLGCKATGWRQSTITEWLNGLRDTAGKPQGTLEAEANE